MTGPRANRLIHENSPYLRQHAHNPVDWYPWGDEVLQAAREQGKPILLSIGYSACHWCHVMERECFEDEDIAALMNQLFLNVKVDREERPDLDTIYMNYVQATTGHGGWPLTVFLAPDGVPFYGGTYFPPRDLHGRPGFPTVLHSVSRFFHEQGHQVAESASEIRRLLQPPMAVAEGKLDRQLLWDGFEATLRMLDARYGGFGGAPKFPGSMSLAFLLRGWRRFGAGSALRGVEYALAAMAEGGIHDQLGGGFHRYSVDERWLVPHFEKMLYDNALLVRVYLEAYQATGTAEYRDTVEATLSYVRDCLTSPEGGFYSSEDADSEGEEGKFYVWSRSEVESHLSAEDADLFCDFYGVTASGNWEGVNILHRRRTVASLADEKGIPEEELKQRLERCRQTLHPVRDRRVRPALDTKILASWNGLMLAACAEAGFALNSENWLDLARRCAGFLWEHLYADGRLGRCFGTNQRLMPGFLDDYAHVAEGFLSLFQATGEYEWLARGRGLVDQAIERFGDPDDGLFYLTARDQETLLVRPKEYFDNATPSGNSTMAVNLLVLYHLTGEATYRERAGRLLGGVAAMMKRYPTGFGNWYRALGLFLGPTTTVVVAGEEPLRSSLVETVRRLFLPDKVVAVGRGDEPVPVFQGRNPEQGAAAWVCRDTVCLAPVSSAAELQALLQES